MSVGCETRRVADGVGGGDVSKFDSLRAACILEEEENGETVPHVTS